MKDKEAYSEQQYDTNYPDGYENHFWNVARNRILLNEIKKLPLKRPVVLDIGCGRGFTVASLRRSGVDCYGSEVGKPNVLTDCKDVVFTAQSAMDLPAEFREKVSVILLLDVLEHIQNPAAFLQECKQAFSQVQALVVTVPARAELWSNYDEEYGHYLRYDFETLRKVLHSASLREKRLGYFFHSLYPVVFFFSKIRKKRTTAIAAPKAIFLHRLISLFFLCDFAVVPRGLPGTSLLAVCEV